MSAPEGVAKAPHDSHIGKAVAKGAIPAAKALDGPESHHYNSAHFFTGWP
jgi:hypothetical protein